MNPPMNYKEKNRKTSSRLSVIVPSNKEKNSIFQLITYLEKQTLVSDQFELIVVYNGIAPTKYKEIRKSSPQSDIDIHWLYSPTPGVNRARNLGARNAHGSLIYFLDDDCLPYTPSHLECCLGYHHRHPELIFGGPYKVNGRSHIDNFYNRMCNLWVESHKDMSQDYRVLLGGNFCLPQTIFKHHSFDENFLSGADETDYFLRLGSQGYKLDFMHDLEVSHLPGKNFKELMATAQRQYRAKPLVFKANYQRNWRHTLNQLQITDFKYIPLAAKYFLTGYQTLFFNKE